MPQRLGAARADDKPYRNGLTSRSKDRPWPVPLARAGPRHGRRATKAASLGYFFTHPLHNRHFSRKAEHEHRPLTRAITNEVAGGPQDRIEITEKGSELVVNPWPQRRACIAKG